MRFALLVALSHLRSRRHDAGVSAIAPILMGGVTVGVMALIMVLSVMEASRSTCGRRFWQQTPTPVALFVGISALQRKADEVMLPEVEYQPLSTPKPARGHRSVQPSATTRASSSAPAGPHPAVGPTGEMTDLEEQREVFQQLGNPPRAVAQPDTDTDELPGMIIGKELADRFVYPASACTSSTRLAEAWPHGTACAWSSRRAYRRCLLLGREYDTKWTYMTLADTQSFLQTDDVASGIEVRVYDPDDERITKEIEQILGKFRPRRARHRQTNASLFAALKLEKIVMDRFSAPRHWSRASTSWAHHPRGRHPGA